MEYVLLKNNSDYYIIAIAASRKHFKLEDAGWIEVFSGEYWECEERKDLFESEDEKGLIQLYCEENFSLIQTTDDCLNQILNNEPDYLENKEFL